MELRTTIKTASLLGAGLLLGWFLAGPAPRVVLAGGGDRSGESIVATGSVMIHYDEAIKSPVPLEAVYLLDYKAGRLVATIPTLRQTIKGTEIVENFDERDLVADFKLDLDAGPRPRFLMTTGSVGPHVMGNAPLYVFETTTSQLAIYRLGMTTQFSPTNLQARPKFELVQLISYARPSSPRASARR